MYDLSIAHMPPEFASFVRPATLPRSIELVIVTLHSIAIIAPPPSMPLRVLASEALRPAMLSLSVVLVMVKVPPNA